MSDDDADKLAEISKQLPAMDVDSTSAELIARRARESVGKGIPKRRIIVAIAIVLFVASFLTWAVVQVIGTYF